MEASASGLIVPQVLRPIGLGPESVAGHLGDIAMELTTQGKEKHGICGDTQQSPYFTHWLVAKLSNLFQDNLF